MLCESWSDLNIATQHIISPELEWKTIPCSEEDPGLPLILLYCKNGLNGERVNYRGL